MRSLMLFVFSAFALPLFGQAIQFTAGINYTSGIPTGAPSASGSRVRIDTATGRWYQWSGSTWIEKGMGIDIISGGVAPSYTPGVGQSWFAVNADEELYVYSGIGTTWTQISGGGGGGGSVTTDATLTGNGSGTPLGIAQQSAATSQGLAWTGATWEPSWGNPTTFVTSSSTLTTATNELLVGTLSADITIGLPTCNAANDSKRFKIVRNGSDIFSLTIDPSSTQTFYDGAFTKIIYGKIAVDCTCRYSAGVGVWFVDNL